jgi:hypothetical protein
MDDEALLAVHVACHIAFYVVVAVRIGLVAAPPNPRPDAVTRH